MSGFKQLNDTEKLERRRVTRAIKLALARIAEKNPELARTLKETIKTGTYLSYMAMERKMLPRRKRTSVGEKIAPSALKNPIQH